MTLKTMIEVLKPLIDIADAYDANELDNEARKFWGSNDQHQNERKPEDIEIYCGRGGKELLTLADCLKAREYYRSITGMFLS